eukprot:276945-Hanusia_phi.AAC.1
MTVICLDFDTNDFKLDKLQSSGHDLTKPDNGSSVAIGTDPLTVNSHLNNRRKNSRSRCLRDRGQ